jgi:hypothetical protein
MCLESPRVAPAESRVGIARTHAFEDAEVFAGRRDDSRKDPVPRLEFWEGPQLITVVGTVDEQRLKIQRAPLQFAEGVGVQAAERFGRVEEYLAEFELLSGASYLSMPSTILSATALAETL